VGAGGEPGRDSGEPPTGAPGAGGFSADPYSYVEPVTNQTAANSALLLNQPNLMTALAAYELDFKGSFLPNFYFLSSGAYPIASCPLIGVIPDAGSLNQHIHPMDGSVISTDVFGHLRTSKGRRDVGAVQSMAPTPGPLALLGFGAAFSWSRRLRRRTLQALILSR
jgi:MYXO-CTERM domain-containing protein